ncbi:putative porin [Paraburkholderia sp. UCT70]
MGHKDMKKTLLAIGVLGAFSVSAYAQNSVTLYGLIDTGLIYYQQPGRS